MRTATLAAGVAFLAGSAFAQAGGGLAFEVASVKPSPPVKAGERVYYGPARGGPGTPDPGQITWTYARFFDLLMTAYDVKNYQISGPDWLQNERYDVVVRVPAGTTKEQVRVMWQNLLAERFGLTLHRESREFRVDELVIAKGGAKLKESAEDAAGVMAGKPPELKDGQVIGPGMIVTLMPGGNGAVALHAYAKAMPMSRLTSLLGGQVNLPVLDKTGLVGYYDFTLEFSAMLPGAPPPAPGGQAPGDSASDPGPNLDAALQQQLGLRLVGSKAKLDVIVIDKADKVPTAN
jgi:uncharacterized protein (TIGR03435 family)